MKGSTDHLRGALAYPQQCMTSKGSSAVADVIVNVVHSLTFAPLVVLIVLQDVHLKLAIVLNTALCICLAIGNFCFFRMGVIRVNPKLLDTFLLAFYGSLIPVVYTQTAWSLQWLTVFHHGSVACFMWLSIVIPCWDNFALEGLKDWLPQPACSYSSTHTAALHAAQGWAGALTIMALAALAPSLSHRMHSADPVYIICDYVLGLVPLIAAAWLHLRCKKRALQAAEQCGQGMKGPQNGGSMLNPLNPHSARAGGVAPAGMDRTLASCSGSDLESTGSSNSSTSSKSNTPDLESSGLRDTWKQQAEHNSTAKKLLSTLQDKFRGFAAGR